MALVVCSLVNVFIIDWSRLINLIKAGKTLFEKLQLRIFSLKNTKLIKDMILYLPYLQRLMIQSFQLSIMLESLEQK